MKRQSREINIFSMSALDLFASALGAFILIAVVLFPYFPNKGDAPKVVAKLTKQLKQCKKEVKDKTKKLLQCQEQLKKKFVLIVISWEKNKDVDLYIKDNAGRLFYYNSKTVSGSPAELAVDSKHDGNEVWLHPSASPGDTFEVYYNLHERRKDSSGNFNTYSVPVKGKILTPERSIPIPLKTLTRGNPSSRNASGRVHIATIRVDANGKAQVTFH